MPTKEEVLVSIKFLINQTFMDDSHLTSFFFKFLLTATYLFLFELTGNKKNQLAPLHDTKPSSEDILNAILPPREWTEDGKHMIQYVSHGAASRVDVARLREMLDQKLMER